MAIELCQLVQMLIEKLMLKINANVDSVMSA
jgi:hypothetical protein